MRILTKGGSITGIQHDEAEWTESGNIKDYDIVILNLEQIIENAGELATPDSSIPQSIEFPIVEEVVKLFSSGNRLYVFLPSTRTIDLLNLVDGEQDETEVDLLSWLPFDIESVEESGVSVDQDSVPSGWQWYFDEDFDWPMYLSRVNLDDDVLPMQNLFSGVSQNTIAQTTFEEDIASQFTIFEATDFAAQLSRDDFESRYPGSIFVLPIKPDYTFEKAAGEILSRYHGFTHDVESVPDWAEDLRLPRQQEIVERSHELRAEFERLDRFNKLLHDDGEELEEIVLEVFEEFGFETLPEIPGKRDGVVLFDEHAFVLETHGTVNAIGVKKVDQLNRWVRNARDEFDDREVSGLLVANAYRTQEPENRGQPIVGDPREGLEDHGYKLLTTANLYKFLQETQKGKLSREDVEEALLTSDLFIT